MNQYRRIIIFGASNAGIAVYERLRKTVTIVAFYDNDPEKQGSSLFDVPVMSPTVPLYGNAEKVVVAGNYTNEMYAQLTEQLGLDPDFVECDNLDGATYGWLLKNKRLRMDANLKFWKTARREFHLDRYRFAAGLVKGLKTLDVACGTGYGTNLLSESAEDVIGVDIDDDSVAYARAHYGGERVSFQKNYAEMLPFDNGCFNAIVSFETIEHVLCPEALLNEFVRLLSPDGVLILSAPNYWGYTSYHFTDFNYEMLKSKIDPLFESTTYYYNNSGSRKGRGARGIGLLDPDKVTEAECILVIANKPRERLMSRTEHLESMLSEIYSGVYRRHQQYFNIL